MSSAEAVLDRPVHEQERRSFDPLASVRLMRHDLMEHGIVLPETLERVEDEELSFLAEGVDRAAKTSFGLKRIDGELVYFDKGQWRPYMGMLTVGLETARSEAVDDPRRKFLEERAAFDYEYGQRMQMLRVGQRLSWYSPYPEHMEVHDSEFLMECGFRPDRKLGFIYQAVGTEEGVILESHTVDRSNPWAFAAAMQRADADPQANITDLIASYDEVLAAELECDVFAGRTEAEIDENVWEEIRAQKDLIEHLIIGIENLAKSELDGVMLEEFTKEHVYGVWAAFKERLDGNTPTYTERSMYGYELEARLSVQQEVQMAFSKFASEGRSLVGCGGLIKVLQGRDAIMSASASEVFDAIFGGSTTGEDTNLPAMIRCINCREKVPKKKVVKPRSWCCPSCKYEVDICNGKVLNHGTKAKR